jgi:hypothetical protein
VTPDPEAFAMTTGTPAPQAGPPPDPKKRYLFVRSMYAWRDLERFLVIAAATILIVRSILSAMGWPQLGGGPIHFAHLLWGGLGMVIALVLLMSMEARIWRVLAVLAAGIGFGLFIDELGKFITSDNNYFFRPAIAIIYLVFVVLVLVARVISRGVARSPQAALVNAFDLSKEAVINDLNQMQRADALKMLDRADQSDPIVLQLRAMVEGMKDLPAGAPWWLLRLRAGAERLYGRVVAGRWFRVVFVGWFALLTLVSVGYAIRYVALADPAQDKLSWAGQGMVWTSVAAGLLVVLGIMRWRRSKLSAYLWFERALLVTIFIYEFFAFYQDQLRAVLSLAIVLVTFAALRIVIEAERALEGQARPATVAEPAGAGAPA